MEVEKSQWKGGMGLSCTRGSGPMDNLTSIVLVGGVVYKQVEGSLTVRPVLSLTKLHFNGTRMPVDIMPSPQLVLQPGVGWLGNTLVVVATRQGKLLRKEVEGVDLEEVDVGNKVFREMAAHIVLSGPWIPAASCNLSTK